MTGVPILTYHSLHAPGEAYAENDHVALASDLRALNTSGFRFVRLIELVERLIRRDAEWFRSGRKVGLSFDDGCNHDFIDFVHPGVPTLKSFYTILREFNDRDAPPARACATSFVIASPVATAVLDQTCIAGRGQWDSRWWRAAAESDLIDIGNHSWDHLHPTLPFVCHSRGARDDFSQVDNPIDAAMQITQAEHFIRGVVGEEHASGLFAYPDGVSNAYLREQYFPAQDLVRAAFSTDPGPVTPGSDRWCIPRYCCGEHWKSSESLLELLVAGA